MSDEQTNGDAAGPYKNGKWLEYKPSEGRSGKVCGAKRLSDGKPCQRRPSANGKCAKHGGLSLGGIASPRFKHGRTSKYMQHLPEKMQASFQEAMADPHITSMLDSVALIDTRVGELLKSLDKSAPPWEKLFEVIGQYKACKTDAGRRTAWRKLEALVVQGEQAAFETEATWREIQKLIGQRASCLFTESKVRKDLEGSIPVEKVILYNRAVLESIRIHVTDPEMLRRVTREVLRLMPPPSVDVNAPPDEDDDAPDERCTIPWDPTEVEPD